MEALLPETVKTVLLGIVAAGILLVWLSRRLPRVTWLEPFRLPAFQPTEAQRVRRRRFGDIKAGLEIMLAGIAVPGLYLLSRVFRFEEPTTSGMLLSGAVAVIGITIGIALLVRSRDRGNA